MKLLNINRLHFVRTWKCWYQSYYFVHKLPCVLSHSDSGCSGKVREESHRALQGRLGSAEPDGLHPERGSPAASTLLDYISLLLHISYKSLEWLWLVICRIWALNQENHSVLEASEPYVMLAKWEFSTRACMLRTVPVLCGSPDFISHFHLHTLAH